MGINSEMKIRFSILKSIDTIYYINMYEKKIRIVILSCKESVSGASDMVH